MIAWSIGMFDSVVDSSGSGGTNGGPTRLGLSFVEKTFATKGAPTGLIVAGGVVLVRFSNGASVVFDFLPGFTISGAILGSQVAVVIGKGFDDGWADDEAVLSASKTLAGSVTS